MNENYRANMQNHLEKNLKSLWASLAKDIYDKSGSCFWLTGASGYILKTKNILWGVDIAFHNQRLLQQIEHRIAEDLTPLRFILLTHNHADHFDANLINHLSGLQIRWLIPDFMKAAVLSETCLQEKKIIWMKNGDSIEIDGIKITAFESFHVMVPSLGYFVDSGEKRILFPGDVRDYSPPEKPLFENIDLLFAHVWLGKFNALNSPWDGYLRPFCEFISEYKAKKIVLTHLYDTERELTEMWTYSHCGAILDEMTLMGFNSRLEIPVIGEGYEI